MKAEIEEMFLAEISKLNTEYWADNKHIEAKEKLIKKFGSREKAIEETFYLIWSGFQIAVKELK